LCEIRKENKWHKAYEGEAMKKSNVFEWHKWFKESSHVEITNENNAHHFFSISRVLFTLNLFCKAEQSTELFTWRYQNSFMNLCREKGLNFGPTIGFSTMTMLQLTRHSVKQFLA
jgi:hypothetical protein